MRGDEGVCEIRGSGVHEFPPVLHPAVRVGGLALEEVCRGSSIGLEHASPVVRRAHADSADLDRLVDERCGVRRLQLVYPDDLSLAFVEGEDIGEVLDGGGPIAQPRQRRDDQRIALARPLARHA